VKFTTMPTLTDLPVPSFPPLRVKVTPEVHEYFRTRNIFQSRSLKGEAATHDTYIRRWREGDTLVIGKDAMVEEHTSFAAGHNIFSLGSFSDVASAFTPRTKIGRHCSIAPGTTIMGFRHPIEYAFCSTALYRDNREYIYSYLKEIQEREGPEANTYRALKVRQTFDDPIVIGNDVWIGDKAVIKGGITIGDGAVIAGHSVLTKSVPPYQIWGGNPARYIKDRFPADIQKGLQETRWWEIELSDLYHLSIEKPEDFINEILRNPGKFRTYKPKVYNIYEDLR